MHYSYVTTLKLEDDEVQIECDEGWGMRPGPKFGCVHWEER